MSTGHDGTIIVVQTQGVTLEDERRIKKCIRIKLTNITFYFNVQKITTNINVVFKL
jgi:hypothetical protein